MALPWSRWPAALIVFSTMAASASGQGPIATPQHASSAARPALRVHGRHFVDPTGRVVILRGVNVSGGAKVPPFLPVTDVSALDPLPRLGMNVIRLVFVWEAYEPEPGRFDEVYLGRMRTIAAAAWARGMYVLVDIHQDGFSRFASRGSGDGFPAWAVSRRASLRTPDNGLRCKRWPVLMATDPATHRSFADFFRDAGGVRTRYLAMLGRVAAAFASVSGVIGYDLLNEPWGDERRDLAPLYRDAAAVIQACDPAALLFVEGHITTNCGLQTGLPRPPFPGAVYAPHYYKPSTIVREGWQGRTSAIDRGFGHMRAKSEQWQVPLFVGEFGALANAARANDYLDCLFDRLDEALASGAQWNYTPSWNDRDKDGWNGEDFNILSSDGIPRPNFVDRPYPRATAGLPVAFRFRRAAYPRRDHAFEFTWEHRPGRGPTEVFMPTRLFPLGSMVQVEGAGVVCRRDEARQVLICDAQIAGRVRVRVTAR